MNYGERLATKQHLILELSEELGVGVQKSVHVSTEVQPEGLGRTA
jgi:hypothetical protein